MASAGAIAQFTDRVFRVAELGMRTRNILVGVAGGAIRAIEPLIGDRLIVLLVAVEACHSFVVNGIIRRGMGV